MIIEDIKWIRKHRHKLCPSIRKEVLKWYKPIRYLPCFLQTTIRPLKQYFNKISVIVETESVDSMGCSTDALAKSSGCKVRKNLSLINCFSTTVNAKSLEKLAENPNVKRVWLDTEVNAILHVASPTVSSPHLWDDYIQGEGVVVAVLDTGVYEHPDLKGRIVASKDFINNKSGTYDDNGHGTHVAGAVASDGSSSKGKYKGPAPKSKIVNVKVLDKMGSGSLSTVIEGIQWCIQNKDNLNIQIMNLSLGVNTNSSYKDDPLCIAVEKAWDSGTVVCAAAGNSGPNPRTISSPGIHPAIITVGATDDKRTLDPSDDSIANFSSRGPTPDDHVKPDVVAPGTDIVSLVSPKSLMDKQNKSGRIDFWYVSMSGTSMACPICAGVIAQMLEVYPNLSPKDVKDLIMASASPIIGESHYAQGVGVINADSLIAISAELRKRQNK